MRYSILFIILPYLSIGQDVINGDDFITNAVSGAIITLDRQPKDIDFSLIEEYDIRSETRDFDIGKQEYTFRVKPSTPAKIKAQQRLADVILNAPNFDENEYLCDKFKTAHQDWLELYTIDQKQMIFENQASILNDKSKVIARLRSGNGYNFNELIKLQEDISEQDFDLKKIAIEKESLLEMHDLYNTSLNFDDFISTSDIKAKLEGHLNDLPVNQELVYDQKLIESEIDLEKAESKQILDFAQFRYRGPHDNLIQERVSLGIGLSLSPSGANTLKIKELEAELEQTKSKIAREEEQYGAEVNSLKSNILTSIKTLDAFKKIKQEEQLNLEKISTDVTKRSGFNPLIILEIKEKEVANRLKIIEMKEDIIKDYIDYLELTGKLCMGTNKLSTRP